MRVMLDLETLGNAPGCVIVAIGAVTFGGGKIREEFYRRVDPESCVQSGLKMDTSTVLWWLKQPEEARLELTKPGIHIAQCCQDFSRWLDAGDGGDPEVWGNGADFDNQILAAAYKAVGHILPWQFWNNRCYRTIKAHYPGVKPTRKNGHNALQDARNQAEHLMQLWPAL